MADLQDVVTHPTEKHVQAVAFNYERKRWQVLDRSIEADLTCLGGLAEGDVDIVARTLDDRYWITLHVVDDGPARFTDIVEAPRQEEDSINKWYYVCVMEGRNREVRRLWESQEVTVSRLKRVRFGPIFLPAKLKKGQWMELTEKDVRVLCEAAEGKK